MSMTILGLMAIRIPGIRTSGFQCHWHEGKAASPFPTAQRDHFVAAKYAGSSTFGNPSGINTQPWSVTTLTDFQFASRSCRMRSAAFSTSVLTRTGRSSG